MLGEYNAFVKRQKITLTLKKKKNVCETCHEKTTNLHNTIKGKAKHKQIMYSVQNIVQHTHWLQE